MATSGRNAHNAEDYNTMSLNKANNLKKKILEDLNELFYLLAIEEREKIEMAIFHINEIEA